MVMFTDRMYSENNYLARSKKVRRTYSVKAYLTFLMVVWSVCQCKDVTFKVSGSLDPGPYDITETMPTLLGPGVELMSSYSSQLSVHSIDAPPQSWIMLELTARRSQFIALCIRKDTQCSAKYDTTKREITISGDEIDSTSIFQYENVLLVQKPDDPSPNYFVTVIMINGRVAAGTTEGKMSMHPQNPICQKCAADQGDCENVSLPVCVCKRGYFGRTCSKRSVKMEEETTTEKMKLKQFEMIHIEDFYSSGESDTQFEIRSKRSPNCLLIINESDDQNYDTALREDRGKQSFITVVDLWNNGVKQTNLEIEKDWMISTLMNLAPDEHEFEFIVFRIKSNTFNVVSLVLYILLVIAIVLLISLSVCVICIRARSAARVRQATKIAEDENSKIGEKEIAKYLPIVDKKAHEDDVNLKDSCTICLDKVEGAKEIRKVLMCGHMFHSECLFDWIKEKEFCPNCKKEFSRKAIKEYESPEPKGQIKVKLPINQQNTVSPPQIQAQSILNSEHRSHMNLAESENDWQLNDRPQEAPGIIPQLNNQIMADGNFGGHISESRVIFNNRTADSTVNINHNTNVIVNRPRARNSRINEINVQNIG